MKDGLLIISAGHGGLTNGVLDRGAIAYNGDTELDHINAYVAEILRCIKSYDAALPQICLHGSVMSDPENLNLAQTIRYINSITEGVAQKSLILDVHMNYNHPTAQGVEVFYSANTTAINRKRASDLSALVSNVLGSPNRGGKPDTASAVGSLGILRQTNAQALLIEPAFLNRWDLSNWAEKMPYAARITAEFMVNEWAKLNP